MPTRNIIVVGASSGGIEALTELARGLPRNLSAAVFVVQHIAADSANYLPKMLARETSLPVQKAEDGRPIQPSHIVVAPADFHLLIDSDQMFLTKGPHENRVRPAVDPLFRSAALAHGPRVIGVVLSGSLDDGTAGAISIKENGGLIVVQDPEDALTPDMPESVLEYTDVDHCVPVAEIGLLLGRLSESDLPEDTPTGISDRRIDHLRQEVDIIRRQTGDIDQAVQLGELAPVSCPDCGGPLWEMEEEFARYRCHTGHAFTARHLAEGLQEAEESSLWVALRVMEERVRMLRRIAKKDNQRGHPRSYDVFSRKADEAEVHVRRLKQLLSRDPV